MTFASRGGVTPLGQEFTDFFRGYGPACVGIANALVNGRERCLVLLKGRGAAGEVKLRLRLRSKCDRRWLFGAAAAAGSGSNLSRRGAELPAEKIAGEIAQGNPRLPGACFQCLDDIGLDGYFVMTVS